MRFERDKRLLLGVLALLVPTPLPFNDVVGWPALAVYWVAVAWFVRRAWANQGEPLPAWGMNLLGLAYLPFLVLDVTLLWQGRALRPLVHLAMFALAVKLFGMKREKDKWHLMLLVFFLFLASMGSSVNPSVILYLIAFLGLALLALARFAGFHVLGSVGVGRWTPRALPIRGFIVGAVLATLALAIPIFLFLPRLGQPYLLAGGRTGGGPAQTSDFLRQVGLDVVSRVRASRSVALRFTYENPPPRGHERRLKGATFSEFRANTWYPGRPATIQLRRQRDGFFHVAPDVPRSWMTLWLQPMGGADLVLPVETRVVDTLGGVLQLDETGVAALLAPPGGTVTYRAGMAEGVASTPRFPGVEEVRARDLDTSGVTPRMAELARQVVAEVPAAERAAQLERHLIQGYEYSLDLVGLQSAEPIDEFLFRARRGHCEYFASAMVLMLRSVDVPARLVTGYLGAEYNPFEEYFIVRQSNAHAWVEAYLPGSGWSIFDPTPPVGRPASATSGVRQLFSQAYDYVLFRWDRYVLTYGFSDQLGLLQRLQALVRDLRARFSSDDADEGLERSVRLGQPRVERAADRDPFQPSPIAWVLVGLGLLGAGFWVWRHRPGLTTARAYRYLRARLQKDQQAPLADSVPALEVSRRLVERFPGASESTCRLIDLYLRESFGGQELTEAERSELKVVLREAKSRLRKTA